MTIKNYDSLGAHKVLFIDFIEKLVQTSLMYMIVYALNVALDYTIRIFSGELAFTCTCRFVHLSYL